MYPSTPKETSTPPSMEEIQSIAIHPIKKQRFDKKCIKDEYVKEECIKKEVDYYKERESSIAFNSLVDYIKDTCEDIAEAFLLKVTEERKRFLLITEAYPTIWRMMKSDANPKSLQKEVLMHLYNNAKNIAHYALDNAPAVRQSFRILLPQKLTIKMEYHYRIDVHAGMYVEYNT